MASRGAFQPSRTDPQKRIAHGDRRVRPQSAIRVGDPRLSLMLEGMTRFAQLPRHGAPPETGSSDEVMAWATRTATNALVWIGQLSADDKGEACGCHCPSCLQPLQAVNPGITSLFLDDGRRRPRPHFRHASGAAGAHPSACRLKVARLLALDLLTKTGWIDLPDLIRTRSVSGRIGAAARWAGHRVGVVSSQWIDQTHCAFVTNDGKRLLVKVTGSLFVSTGTGLAEPGDLGSEPGAPGQATYDGVLTLQVDDPELAKLSTEELLARLQPISSGLCWNSHWEDASLQRQLDAQEAGSPEDAEGLTDDDLQALLDTAQAHGLLGSESLLHFVVKRLVLRSGSLLVPANEAWLPVPPGRNRGSWGSDPYDPQKPLLRWPARVLMLSRPRMEDRSLEGIVPDLVVAMAAKPGPQFSPAHDATLEAEGEPFDVHVEVVVSNPVSAQKLDRIRALDIACLVIDVNAVQGIRQEGRIHVTQLRRAVITTVQGKRWLHHPAFAAASEPLIAQAERERRELAETERKKRQQAQQLASMSAQEVGAAVINLAERYWAMTGGEADDYTNMSVRIERGFAEMAKKLDRAMPPDIMTLVRRGTSPVSWVLALARGHGDGAAYKRTTTAWQVINAAMNMTPSHRAGRYFSFIAAAAVAYPVLMTDSQRERFDHWVAMMQASIDANEDTYARDSAHDAFMFVMFPPLLAVMTGHGYVATGEALGASIKPGLWTIKHVQSRLERLASEARHERQMREIEKANAQQLARQREHDQAELLRRLEAMAWREAGHGLGSDEEQAVHLVVRGRQALGLPETVARDMGALGWQARAQGWTWGELAARTWEQHPRHAMAMPAVLAEGYMAN